MPCRRGLVIQQYWLGSLHINVDSVTPAVRRRIMAAVPRRNTKPERLLRSELSRVGLQYRGHVKSLPGTPDIVILAPRIAIFVHGCFWHRHARCKFTTTPSTRGNFWKKKFNDNVVRDGRNIRRLRSLGWTPIVVWQCQINRSLDRVIAKIVSRIAD